MMKFWAMAFNVNAVLKDVKVPVMLDYDYEYKDFLFFVANEPHEHVSLVLREVFFFVKILALLWAHVYYYHV